MIRKWFKINTCFAEILKNSAASNNLEKKWNFDSSCRQYLSCSSLYNGSPYQCAITSASAGDINKQVRASLSILPDPNEKGDAESWQSSDSDETAVAETPARTELFEVKGPNGSAFLIEVHAKDLDEVRTALVRMKGDYFQFDKTVIEWFTMKCILSGEFAPDSGRDGERLAKVHCISSGCEEVYFVKGKYFFVNSVDKTMRAKRLLERFGYKITGILYRFQPKEKVSLNDRVKDVCSRFVEAVEKLPKVISITHNL